MRALSGDHSALQFPTPSVLVRLSAGPPLAGIRKILSFSPPPTPCAYSSHFPSGDGRPSVVLSSEITICTGQPPPAGTVQRFSRPEILASNVRCVPSADHSKS